MRPHAASIERPERGSSGTPRHPMLPAEARDLVLFDRDSKPRLLFIVDAEEEFNWRMPFSRSNRSVATMAAQSRAHEIFQRYGIVPTYAVDYPVVSQEDGRKILREFLQAGACEIGTQLHPWVTPPYEEEVSERNSFACNLPPDLERRKIEAMTSAIEEHFGHRPKLYRAGRYGAGAHTTQILEDLGYEIDCSVLPGPQAEPHAPDYFAGTALPYWLGRRRSILEIPVTVGTVGMTRRLGEQFYRTAISPIGRMLKLQAFLARFGLMDRIRLSPEGNTVTEAKRLTRALLQDGQRVFTASYHSPSLEPGNTPYVRTRKDLDEFLYWLESYCEFFMGEIQGLPSTPLAIRKLARS